MSTAHARVTIVARRLAGLAAATVAVLCAANVAHAAPFAYVTNQGGTVSQYDVAAGGLLAPLVPATVAARANPRGVAVSPDGRSVYVANLQGDSVSQFDVDGGGRLSPKTPATVSTGSDPIALAVSPDGGSVYVTDYGGDTISQFDMGAGGRLAPKSPATVPAGDGPSGVAVSPDGRSVYVADVVGWSVSQLDVGPGGRLAPKSPATVAVGRFPWAVAVSPDGRSAYVTSDDDSVWQFDVGAGGALAPKSPATVAAGNSPTAVAVSPDGGFAYVVDAGLFDDGGSVSQYRIGAGGRLAPLVPGAVPAGRGPRGLAVSPDGGSVYVATYFDNGVAQYDVGADGALTPKRPPTVAAGSHPSGVALSPAAGGNRRPSCAGVHAVPATLLPATRKLETVALTGATDLDGDPLSYHVDRVVQDEPVSAPGIGDPTSPDAQVTAAGAGSDRLLLRAERNPQRDGRVYRIAYGVSDGRGGRCSATVAETNAVVAVPRKPGEAPVDNYDRGVVERFDSLTGAQLTEGRDRFAQVTGPLRDAMIFPDEFGVDLSRLSVDVAALAGAVDAARLRADVDARFGAADHVAAQLSASGYAVQREPIGNVFADRPGTTCPSRMFVVGAHYDRVGSSPGADDNGSGVAGMLEVARVLSRLRLPITVRYAGFALEEAGLIGSRAMATELKAQGADVAGMVSLEMIGFTSRTTDVFLGTTNDYLAMVGDPRSAYLARVFGAAAWQFLPHFFAPASVIPPGTLADILRSDHASFWAQGYPALMLTDTANFRNPNYHRPTDTIDTLDFGFMADSTRATIAGLVALATVDADGDRRPDVCEAG